MEKFLETIYRYMDRAKTAYHKRNTLRDVTVVKLLFATGMRISQLCNLKSNDVGLEDGTILIYGKVSKERRIQIGNQEVIDMLKKYRNDFCAEIEIYGYFFINQFGKVLSAVIRMINKYATMAAIELHTFATVLLEADVDIRYIQEMLGFLICIESNIDRDS